MSLTIERDGETFAVDVAPVVTELGGVEVARIGVLLGGRDTAGAIGSITRGADEVGASFVETVQSVTRVFGPEGIGRVFELVFTDAPRDVGDPASIVGVGKIAGSLASDPGSNYWDILYLFGIVNIFVGFLNLLPLPPFDGGHLAVLAVEKLRGRPVDMRKVIPVSAAVAAFFILFTVAVVYVDIVKPPV
jgi:membrane-associated protease RseP (regulator of RpoE activity)